MAIGINDLDDDNDFLTGDQQTQESNQTPPPPTTQEPQEDDYMSDFLKSRGIDDPSKIKFEDDNNQLIERDWKDLSKDEKLNILNMPLEEQTDDLGLTDEEMDLLDQIRKSNMSPSDYIKSLTPVGEQEPQYDIDQLSDDEVYLLDLESRVGELTEEQAATALNIAKQQDEELYKKQIEGIRKEYKEREDFRNQQSQAQAEQEKQEEFDKFRNQIVDAIDEFNSVGNLDLSFEDSDKEDLAEFILSQDESGKNYLFEALQDPQILTRAAWFILKGEEAFNSITDYFTNQIKLVSENQYRKGLEEGKKGIVSKPSVVIKQNNNNFHRTYNSIEDLDDED